MPRTQTWTIATTVAQLILGTTMCTLVTAKFVRDSLQMNQATGKWQLNRYMSLLVRDNLLYFFVYVPSSPSPFFVRHIELNNTPRLAVFLIGSSTCSVF